MKQSDIGSPHPARSRRIAGRAQEDHILDPYQRQRKMRERTLCPRCGAVYNEGRWRWSAAIAPAHRETCPARRRIADRMPAGIVTVKGPSAPERADEPIHLARHGAEAENSEHPLNRIINIERDGDDIVINTTDAHLPRRIGEAVERAFHMKPEAHFDRDDYFARITRAPTERPARAASRGIAAPIYHFLFVPLTLGLSLLLAIMESVYVMTGRPISSSRTTLFIMAGRDIGLSADRARVYRLGVPRAARPGNGGRDHAGRARLLLRGPALMSYFTWVLGLACAFAILNARWLELGQDDAPGRPGRR